MRGGAQSHLVEASDGNFYIVKFQNNPQHRRVLVNEWISTAILHHLQILTPEMALIQVGEEFLADNPDLYMSLGSRKIPVVPGLHLGSKHPGDPERLAVYDFIPDGLLPQVVNLKDFLGVLVFDKWVGNADGRQSIFFRARVQEWDSTGSGAIKLGFVAMMIDNGFAFDGPNWEFADAPLQGLYGRGLVYERVRGLDAFQPWLDQMLHFPIEVVRRAGREIPPQWFDGDEHEFQHLIERLMLRRRRLPDLMLDLVSANSNLFPNWRSSAA